MEIFLAELGKGYFEPEVHDAVTSPNGRNASEPALQHASCPVTELKNWLSMAKIENGSVFRAVKKNGSVQSRRLSGEAVAVQIKDYVSAIGLNPANFSGHSLRAGFVTSAAMAGVLQHSIRAQTGHTTETLMLRYIRVASLLAENAAGRLL